MFRCTAQFPVVQRMNEQYTEALRVLRKMMNTLRADTPITEYPVDRAASSDVRTGYIEGRPVRRLVVTLRSPGCSWVSRGGGCTMCGHWAGTTRGVLPDPRDTVRQFVSETARYNLDNIEVISIYNSGSILNPDEIHPVALENICTRISGMPSVGKVVLETRAEYVDPAVVASLARLLGPDIRLSIAIGLETADDRKRDLLMNKGCSLEEMKRVILSLEGIADVQLYVLLGLPFLTESELIGDAVRTIYCAADLGADEIHIEPATLQRYTLSGLLAEAGLYRLPSLYSLYEVLRTVVPDVRPYVSPFMHMPPPDRIPEGCSLCTDRLIYWLLERYNLSRDRKSLEYGSCGCMAAWRRRLEDVDPRPLEQRVLEAVSGLLPVDSFRG